MKNKMALIVILIVALSVRLGIGVFLGFNSGPDQMACGADTQIAKKRSAGLMLSA